MITKLSRFLAVVATLSVGWICLGEANGQDEKAETAQEPHGTAEAAAKDKSVNSLSLTELRKAVEKGDIEAEQALALRLLTDKARSGEELAVRKKLLEETDDRLSDEFVKAREQLSNYLVMHKDHDLSSLVMKLKEIHHTDGLAGAQAILANAGASSRLSKESRDRLETLAQRVVKLNGMEDQKEGFRMLFKLTKDNEKKGSD